MTDKPEGMRERTRRVVQAELTVIAQDLFLKNGYEATTVEAIAEAAAMSKRTFFRYFSSKEDLVIGKYVRLGDKVAQAFSERPADEPVWVSLRQTLGVFEQFFDDPAERERKALMERIMTSTPVLNAAYLEKFSRMQGLVTKGVRERLGNKLDPSDPRPAALVGSAFACLLAAVTAWQATSQLRPFGEILDETMSLFEPIWNVD